MYLPCVQCETQSHHLAILKLSQVHACICFQTSPGRHIFSRQLRRSRYTARQSALPLSTSTYRTCILSIHGVYHIHTPAQNFHHLTLPPCCMPACDIHQMAWLSPSRFCIHCVAARGIEMPLLAPAPRGARSVVSVAPPGMQQPAGTCHSRACRAISVAYMDCQWRACFRSPCANVAIALSTSGDGRGLASGVQVATTLPRPPVLGCCFWNSARVPASIVDCTVLLCSHAAVPTHAAPLFASIVASPCAKLAPAKGRSCGRPISTCSQKVTEVYTGCNVAKTWWQSCANRRYYNSTLANCSRTVYLFPSDGDSILPINQSLQCCSSDVPCWPGCTADYQPS